MKKSLLLAAVAALFGIGPAAAEGYLGASYSSTELGNVDVDTWQGEGAFGLNSGGWGAQLNGTLGNLEANGSDADFYTLDGHIYFNGAGWRLGGLVSYADVDDGGGYDEINYGIEGMFDLGSQANVFASYVIGESDFGDLDVSSFELGMNYYVTPNARIGANFNAGTVEDSPFKEDTRGFGINGEFQPWSMPLSLTAGWNQFEVVDTEIPESETFSIGVRWNFGGGTLQERNNAMPFEAATMLGRIYGVR